MLRPGVTEKAEPKPRLFTSPELPPCCAGKATRRARLVILLILAALALAPLLARSAPLEPSRPRVVCGPTAT
jgi:hypothetical protein